MWDVEDAEREHMLHTSAIFLSSRFPRLHQTESRIPRIAAFSIMSLVSIQNIRFTVAAASDAFRSRRGASSGCAASA